MAPRYYLRLGNESMEHIGRAWPLWNHPADAFPKDCLRAALCFVGKYILPAEKANATVLLSDPRDPATQYKVSAFQRTPPGHEDGDLLVVLTENEPAAAYLEQILARHGEYKPPSAATEALRVFAEVGLRLSSGWQLIWSEGDKKDVHNVENLFITPGTQQARRKEEFPCSGGWRSALLGLKQKVNKP